MIYKFTDEEQAIIRDFEQKTKAEHPNIAEVFENVIEDITEVEEENGLTIKIKKDPQSEQIVDDLRTEFKSLIDQMEQKRFRELKTQKQILENAESTIKEAIIFTYNFLQLSTVESPATYPGHIVISGFTYKTYTYCNYIFNHGSQALFDCAIEKDLKSINVLIDGAAQKEYLLQDGILNHLERLKGGVGEKKLYRLIDKALEQSKYISIRTGELKADLALYKKHMPIYHGEYIKMAADVTKKPQILEPLSNEIVVSGSDRDYIYRLSNADNIKGLNRINTHKLFMVCVAEFTKLNTYKDKSEKRNYSVKFPLKDYAALLGYNVLENPAATKEEAEKEKKRAKEGLKNARKAIRQDLDVLFNCSYSWKETIKGKEEDFEDIRIIGAKAIRNGYIEAEITPSFGEYILKHSAMTQYPQALLSVDGQHDNAYYLGLKMAEQWHIYKNQAKGTNNILSIKTILDNVDLPSIGKIRKQRASWQQKIKEPLEQALDYLQEKQFLIAWEYVKAKGEPISDLEMAEITKGYALYEKLYLKFDIDEN